MTELKCSELLKNLSKELIQEISCDDSPASFLYFALIDGYTRCLIDVFDPDRSEAPYNVRIEAAEIKNIVSEKVKQVQEANKYRDALQYCKERLSKTAGVNKVLHSATTSEVIHLYQTAWNNPEPCDFYDEYEELEAKYLKKKEVKT